MIVESKNGNILFDMTVDAIVIPVNCKGVAGAGLARDWKIDYPKSYRAYVRACENKLMNTGDYPLYTYGDIGDTRKHFLFPTKNHWEDKSNLSDIKATLNLMASYDFLYTLKSIGFPKIGCGLGGLDWSNVRPLILEAFYHWEGKIVLYE